MGFTITEDNCIILGLKAEALSLLCLTLATIAEKQSQPGALSTTGGELLENVGQKGPR